MPAAFIGRIASPATIAAIERQKSSCQAGQASRHEHEVRIGRKVYQRPTFELEDDFSRVTVGLILAHRVLHCLARLRIFKFQSYDGNAVDAQDHVERVFVAFAVVQLPGDAHTICGVVSSQLGIQFVGRLEKSYPQCSTVALEAVPKRR